VCVALDVVVSLIELPRARVRTTKARQEHYGQKNGTTESGGSPLALAGANGEPAGSETGWRFRLNCQRTMPSSDPGCVQYSHRIRRSNGGLLLDRFVSRIRAKSSLRRCRYDFDSPAGRLAPPLHAACGVTEACGKLQSSPRMVALRTASKQLPTWT
jgi:hypothetical protein